jgi:hypothetical protein
MERAGSKKIKIPKDWNYNNVWHLDGNIRKLSELVNNNGENVITETPVLFF